MEKKKPKNINANTHSMQTSSFKKVIRIVLISMIHKNFKKKLVVVIVNNTS